MSFHHVDEITERLREIAKKWAENILHGHGTVEECAEELEAVAMEIEQS